MSEETRNFIFGAVIGAIIVWLFLKGNFAGIAGGAGGGCGCGGAGAAGGAGGAGGAGAGAGGAGGGGLPPTYTAPGGCSSASYATYLSKTQTYTPPNYYELAYSETP